MKTKLLFLFISLSLSGCYFELELDPPFVSAGSIDEYETKEVISEVWSRGVLIHEEAIYIAWLDIEFYNSGGMTAYDVWAEITFYDGHRELKTIAFDLPNLRRGITYSYTLDTGYESMYDYTDYQISVSWE